MEDTQNNSIISSEELTLDFSTIGRNRDRDRDSDRGREGCGDLSGWLTDAHEDFSF